MLSRKTLLLSCVFVQAAFASAAFAQADTSNMIEELVVTAEKREQSLQDVPVAVSAYTDERRELVGINSVQDLTNFTPGLAYSTNNDRINMRGIGRFTNNRSSEGGVAMYSDGVYTSSVTQFAKSTLFIDRTEVLRGPQGTLYGRNSIGGAMNIISKRPTDDFYAEVRGSVGNYDTWATEAAISGPLFGSIQGRLAGTYSSQGDAYFTNLNPNGKDEGAVGDQWQVEGQLQGELADGKLEWWAKAETVEWHNLGRGPGGRTTAQYGIRDNTSPFQATLTPNAAGFGLPLNLPGNTCQFCFDTDDGNYINLESNTYAANVTLHLENFDVKYIGGYTYYDYRLQTDLDTTSRQAPFLLPLPASARPLPLPAQSLLYYPRRHNQYQEEVWWFSNELNFASTHEGPVQWLLGLYQFREGSNYTLSDARYVDDPRFATPTNQQGVPVAPNPERRYGYGSSSNVSESFAVFGQTDWQFTDELKLTAGLRYTYDRKSSFESARLMCLYSATVCPVSRITGRPVDVTDVAAPGTSDDRSVYLPAFTDPTTGIRHRGLKNNWSGVTGTLGLDWQPDPDTLAYAKYTRGYKAGGFNSGTTTLTANVTTEEETIDAYEVGFKKTFGGTFQANASAYYYDYQDIQIPISGRNQETGLTVTRFFNMPKARIIGFELETIWQPIDNLQLLANYSYLNAELREACCFIDPDDPQGGAANQAQDLKGAKLPSSTPHRFTVNANYTWELDPGDVSASLTYVWKDATYYSIFNEYYNRAKAWEQVDARLLFNDADDRFTVIAFVKNLFKSEGVSGIDGDRLDTGPNGLRPTGDAFVNQTVSYVPPRTYGVELQFRF